MDYYSDFQKSVALTYAHAQFLNYLSTATASEKEFTESAKSFSDFLEAGLEMSLNFKED